MGARWEVDRQDLLSAEVGAAWEVVERQGLLSAEVELILRAAREAPNSVVEGQGPP